MTAQRSLVLTCTLAALLVVVLAAVLVVDGTRPERIADGVRIGGIDVGGLDPASARLRLDEGYVQSLRKPVRVRHGKQRFALGPEEANIQVDVDTLVRQALQRSDAGGPFARTWRRVTGARVRARLDPEVTYSAKALDRLVDKVARKVNRPARDAELSISADGVAISQSQIGHKVKAGKLREQLDEAIVASGRERRVVADTIKVRPGATTAKLAKENPVVLIASRATHTLRLYRDLKLEKSYGIAVGQPAYPTPSGQFTIANKQVDPVWSVPNSPWAGELAGTTVQGGTAENPLKARWLGITDGVGIHGTSDDGSIGTDASHGCLRMHVPDVIDLFPRVPVGAKVLIV